MPIELSGDIKVAPPELPTVTIAPPGPHSVTVLPVAGAPGPTGPPGGSYYVHTQLAPASTWIIDHDLGKKVHVTIFDAFGIVIHADIAHGTTNQATVTFPDPTVGSAVIS